MSDPQISMRARKSTEERKRNKTKRLSLTHAAETARSIFGGRREKIELDFSQDLEFHGVIPTISDSQKEALFRAKIDTILDANRVYKRKSHTQHKRIFELEETFRYYLSVKESLADDSGEKRKKIYAPKPFDPNEMGMEGFTIPLEERIGQLKSVEEAQELYDSLLLEYIEHQQIIDQMIAAKVERVRKIKEELHEAGWKTPRSRNYRSVAKVRTRSDSVQDLGRLGVPKEIREMKEDKGGKTLSRTVSRTFRKRLLPSKSARVHTDRNEIIHYPEGPTVSESIYSNKDMLEKKKHGTNTEGSVTPDDFMVMSIIGQGAFGKVFLVVKKDTGQLMAMKVMQKESILEDGEDSIRHVVHELEFMRDMSHHPFIVSLYHAFQTDNSVSLVMEWIGGGTVFDWLVKRDVPFSEDEARFYAAQVLLALQAMHSNDIVYRDLKLENILLDEDGYIRLSDFGLSARAKRGERIHSFSGTATYLAPEIINDTGENGHTHTVDLWCFGVMLFIMLTQEPPFWAEHYPDLFQLIQTSEIPFKFYKHLSKRAVSVLEGLLAKDPEKRLGCGPRGIAEVQDHPFFQSVDWKLLLAKKITPPLKPELNKGKPADPDEAIEEPSSTHVPVDLFKGFSFVWDPNQSHESFLTEGIDILRSESRKPNAKPNKSKNRVVVNFFLWAKEVQGLPGKVVGNPVSLRWKHESKKHVTLIGPSDDSKEVHGETSEVMCNDARSVVFEGAMDNACIACDYLMIQDRKNLTFESRVITFQLLAAVDRKKKKKKVLGKLSIDLRDYSFHKLEKTLIFGFGESGATLVISIFCSWKSFNGDLVDNYENHLKSKNRNNSSENLPVKEENESMIETKKEEPEEEKVSVNDTTTVEIPPSKTKKQRKKKKQRKHKKEQPEERKTEEIESVQEEIEILDLNDFLGPIPDEPAPKSPVTAVTKQAKEEESSEEIVDTDDDDDDSGFD